MPRALPKKYNYPPIVSLYNGVACAVYVRKPVMYPSCVDFQARHGYTIDTYRYKFAHSVKCSIEGTAVYIIICMYQLQWKNNLCSYGSFLIIVMHGINYFFIICLD